MEMNVLSVSIISVQRGQCTGDVGVGDAFIAQPQTHFQHQTIVIGNEFIRSGRGKVTLSITGAGDISEQIDLPESRHMFSTQSTKVTLPDPSSAIVKDRFNGEEVILVIHSTTPI